MLLRNAVTGALVLGLTAGTAFAKPEPQQKPLLASWYSKIASYLPASLARPTETAKSVVSDAASAASATASAVVLAKKVDIPALTLENWRATLHPSSTAATGPGEPEEWWILVTGGNKTCHGECDKVERAFNESAIVFSASLVTPHPAMLNCDDQAVLCCSWAAAPPSIWHVLIPRSPDASIDIRIIPLNSSSISAAELVQMHVDQSWRKHEPYHGVFHPFEGFLARYQLGVPVGYVYSIFSMFPTWTYMIVISFLSRNFMTRGVQRQQQRQGRQPNPGRPAGPQ